MTGDQAKDDTTRIAFAHEYLYYGGYALCRGIRMNLNYEKLVAKLKEKRQQLPFANVELMERFEPQFREFRESINTSVSNSFASQWISRLNLLINEEQSVLRFNATPEARLLYDKLQVHLGTEIHSSTWHQITQEQINLFAYTTGDRQWIHIDNERAQRDSPFRSTIAHGYLLLALLPVLRSGDSSQFYPEARFVVNSGLKDLRFLTPVKPEQRIRSRTYLMDMTLYRRHIEVVEDVVVEIENSERTALTATIEIKLFT